ncbi:hypothetical protein GCM10010862_11890 [Devosia nitrariae]|uniref:histidine kinase n=1 Tax=Devosia nitrariae TaxID=2071872 RepID=A0ABQ5W1K6_9HYPH|nr:hypothetical protein GCM10010862_11890 [Devosia nitrariae]
MRAKMGRDVRRNIQKTVLDARQRLTSSSGTRASFDYELMQAYTGSRIGAALPISAIVVILAVVASFWVPFVFTAVWAGMVLLSLLAVALMCRRFQHTEAAKFNAEHWTTNFVAAETVYGITWSLIPLFGLLTQADALAVVTFAMVLVSIASNAVATRTLTPATVMSTLPATLTVSINLVSAGGTLNYTLGAIVLCAEIFFVYLARQLHASELERISHQAEKDSLIAELEEAQHMSDEARRHAEQANMAKSLFLATMSHELRTPLTSVIGNAELMELVTQSEEDRRLSLRAIKDSGRHLLDLVSELLDLSRIEAGKYDLSEEALSLTEVAAKCVEMLGPRAKAKGIDLTFSYGKNLPKLWGDERAIRQVVLNLLSNAIKFTPQGGKVTLVINRSADGGQLISVKDNGPGIPEEEIETVFSSFGQGSLAQKTAEQGAGLGLTIVRNLMELHQGRFDLISKVRFGTEVIASFPRARVMDALAPVVERRGSEVSTSVSGPASGMAENDYARPSVESSPTRSDVLRILIVEDDASILHVIQTIAITAGHDVTTAPDGETALALLQEREFHCVLLDMHLPGIRGTEVKEEFDAFDQGAGFIPVFFAVTGDASSTQRGIYKSLGFHGVVEKPFYAEDILAAFSDAQLLRKERSMGFEYPPEFDAERMAKLERSLDSNDFVDSLLQASVSLSSRAEALAQAVRNGDLLSARKICHTVAGTAGQFGLTALQSRAKEALLELDKATAATMESAVAPLIDLIDPAVKSLAALRRSR